MSIHIVGAGPGDPELITVKGQRLLAEADLVIYTGSLVNPRVLEWARPEAERRDSAGMTLEEITSLALAAHCAGRRVVRLHTGDPSLYGAMQEELDAFRAAGVDCPVVPGVSSFTAAAAVLGRELTVPEVSQTVILTRVEGRTPVPEAERLSSLAAHRATLCLFLSAGLLEQAQADLLAGYLPETPAAIVYKASWPEERVVWTSVGELAAAGRQAGIRQTALVLVGDCLGAAGRRSRLYDPGFRHGRRG